MSVRGGIKSKSKFRNAFSILVALALPLGLAAPGSAAYPRPGDTQRVSVASGGKESRPPASVPRCNVGFPGAHHFDLSAKARYVAFASDAPDLVAGDTNQVCDVFVHDTKTLKTERVSVATDGSQALPGPCGAEKVDGSGDPHISASGRYVAFASCAPNLVAGDIYPGIDVFVHDRRNGTTSRIATPLPITGERLGGGDQPAISEDGRYVTLRGQWNLGGITGIFVHDRSTGKISERVDILPSGTASVTGTYPSISSDGRHVAFTVWGDSLPENDLNGVPDVYVRDRKTDTTVEVSISSDGTRGRRNGGLTFANDRGTESWGGRQLSADGRYVVFTSGADGLVPSDTNARTLGRAPGFDAPDVFVHDLKTGRTERVSVSPEGAEGPGHSGLPAISRDGRYVSFHSMNRSFIGQGATEAYGGATYVHDRLTGANVWVSSPFDGNDWQRHWGQAGGGYSEWGTAIDPTGRFAGFMSRSDRIVRGDGNEAWDVFVRDIGPELGVGGFEGSPPSKQEPPDDRICIQPDLCIPPGGTVSSSDASDDLDYVLTEQGAKLYGASLAYRPQYKDLFVKIELEHMPKVTPVVSPIFYGLRFTSGGKSYEARATSLNRGTFGLFDCTDSAPLCTKVATLRGGYGTTGERVVVSLPLDEIGLENGGEVTGLEAFSALGSYASGAQVIYDRLRVR